MILIIAITRTPARALCPRQNDKGKQMATRKIFYNRRSRRRAVAAAGLVLSAATLFAAGLYTGIALAPLFEPGQIAATNEPAAILAAAEF